MNCDDLLSQEGINVTATPTDNYEEKKERLLTLVASGKSQLYLGLQLTPEQVQRLKPDEIVFLHNRYDKVLGAQMVKSLGHSIIKLYTKVMGTFFDLDNEDDLTYDLQKDPVLINSLGEITRVLYYKFGSLLAPFSAGLITFQHIKLFPIKNGPFESGDENGEFTGGTPDNSADCTESN